MSRAKITYAYMENGITPYGKKIPNIPVVYLVLRRDGRAIKGPTLVDTGFDGGVYANIFIAYFLRGVEPIGTESLSSVGKTIRCEVFEAHGSLIEPNQGGGMDVGRLSIYVPTDPESISEDVILGREVLNKLGLHLNGRTLTASAV